MAKREKAIGTLSKIVCDGCGACCGCFSKSGWENLYDYILKREEEARKEERKETAGAILSAWKQISRSYDSGETQKKSFERIERLAEFYNAEVEE